MIGGKVVSTTGRRPLESQGVSLGRSLRLSELPISDHYLDFSGEFLVPPSSYPFGSVLQDLFKFYKGD